MSTAGFRSPLFALSSMYIDDLAEKNSLFAITEGLGTPTTLADFSPRATEARIAQLRHFLAALDSAENTPTDDIDRIAAIVMRERWTSALHLAESGESDRTFSVLWSPVSEIRQAFDLIPHESDIDRERIVGWLGQVRPALATWKETLDRVASRGELPSRRHVLGVAEQAVTYSEGTFDHLVSTVETSHGPQPALRAAAAEAQAAFGEFGRMLSSTYAPQATASDYVGERRYLLWASHFTGKTLDLHELYAWGWQDLSAIHRRMMELAKEFAPNSATLADAIDVLDADEKYLIHGEAALISALEKIIEGANSALEDKYFAIDPRIRHCDVKLAPPGSASAAYYIGPNEDLSRPGSTWFPTMGATEFPLWRSISTWYHEGVPGHHLESATSLINADRLSRFHRIDGWISGYGEGWALYAERLMFELGFMSDYGAEMGYLVSQALRAARIVVDIGMHLQLPAPADLGYLEGIGDCSGRVWTPEMAVALLQFRACLTNVEATSEVDRYLGNPGQAISYKVGEREWIRAREAATARYGEKFDFKKFHKFALDLGPMGLDSFASEMANF
ncbi:MAG: DUF885 family protein [Acidobacteria bacterium]|nr:DUF885 family protein [Acidobacteriota bacterium]